MSMLPQWLEKHLDRLPGTDRYLVAYSGGRDSHVLLHLLARRFGKSSVPGLSAVHINHGLQPEAGKWAAHCLEVCRKLDVPCRTIELKLAPARGESPEAQAREARYQALESIIETGDVLMTAHHQQDQAETVLLQLFRGAGPAGLSAMPALSRFGRGYMARPLLDASVADIDDYARREQLCWIDDPTNQSFQYDRNFIRNRIIPILSGRWPALARTISRSARHCAESQELVDTIAAADLAEIRDSGTHTLALPGLLELASSRARAVLRAWIRNENFPLPGSVQLERVLSEMTTAGRDRNPLVQWPGAEIRRFQDRLYIMQPMAPLNDDLSLVWDGHTTLRLPAGIGRLESCTGPGGLSQAHWRTGVIRISFRVHRQQRIRIAGRNHSTSFKNLFQQFAVPVWNRNRIPLVYLDDELAAVADLCICEPFAVPESEQGIHINWIR